VKKRMGLGLEGCSKKVKKGRFGPSIGVRERQWKFRALALLLPAKERNHPPVSEWVDTETLRTNS